MAGMAIDLGATTSLGGFRSFFFLDMLHPLLSRRCSPHASLEIVT